MKTSQFLLATLKETPADAETISHQLMLRAGLVRKLSSGLYSWLPQGLRVLRKIEKIVREELEKVGACELLLPCIQPADLWIESGRWDNFNPPLLKMHDRHQNDFCFGPTHEEVITDLMRKEIRSYKQLPLVVYQIQTKFRDELRPRAGVMRAREFFMKDAYSFNDSTESLQETYELMYQAYMRIFQRLQLDFRAVMADSGDIGGDVSHEFHVLAASGEDRLAVSDSSDYAANIELTNAVEGDPSPDGKGKLKIIRGIEIGHIFQLGTKYSAAMNATILNKQGRSVPVHMGCYGIGISRLVAAAIEQGHDEKGIIWPASIAPFQIVIVPVNRAKCPTVKEASDALYQELLAAGYEVLLDDRNERPGVMFADMELIGIPHRLVISERGLTAGTVEYKDRTEQESREIGKEQVLNFLQELDIPRSK